MVSRDEIIKAAATGQDIPPGLDLADVLLYEVMSFLYERHKLHLIDLDRAKADKQAILDVYDKTKGALHDAASIKN